LALVNAETEIRIVGGGPAGSAAAIAACGEGAQVHVFEKSRTAHHKVCGEFLSAEACQLLQELGVWPEFLDLKPARIRRCTLRFGLHVKEWNFPEQAFGLSRLELDRLLLNSAEARGAKASRGERLCGPDSVLETPLIVATGRPGTAPRPGRLFAFKSHFDGLTDDAVEVFFGHSSYIGVSPVENGITNVCGIAPEKVLRRYAFQFDDFLAGPQPLAERLRPLSRRMPWLATGPLRFCAAGGDSPHARFYAAGDALAFVDPFTGSGILNALLTGRLAGTAAARESRRRHISERAEPLCIARLLFRRYSGRSWTGDVHHTWRRSSLASGCTG
jgi:flavin-dependent dehydrogenase